MSELNLILLGPPGAGKGTQAERLVDDFDLPYYATGDILRAAVQGGAELGKEAKKYMDDGDLVPDEVICEVIIERIDSARGRRTASCSTASRARSTRPRRSRRSSSGAAAR